MQALSGFEIVHVIARYVQKFLLAKEATDILAANPLGFRAWNAEGPAPKMEASFPAHGAIESKLILQINMFCPGPLAIQIPVGH